MKSGETISKEKIAKVLGVKLISVPVYIHELKSQFKAKILSVREGRKVVGYKLDTKESKNIKVPQFRRNAVSAMPAKKPVTANNVVQVSDDGSIPVLDKDAEITRVSDREFADIRSSLGVDSGFNYSNE